MTDPAFDRNLDALGHRLTDLEARLDAAVSGSATTEDVTQQVGSPHGLLSYEGLSDFNETLRLQQGWGDADLNQWLTEEQKSQLVQLRAATRLPWTGRDFFAVGLAGVIGALACMYDDQVDKVVREQLGRLKQWDVIKGWERDARRLPIDYTGPGFGGPAHRVRSAGHDVGRPFEALRQIREGEFKGVRWAEGVRSDYVSPEGAYRTVDSLSEALTLWAKHLLADVVTPMSLPLPGWTKLYELDSRLVRKFAHDAYQGSALGAGLNVRSGLLAPGLCVLTTEVVVRGHASWEAYQLHGSFALTPAEQRKRVEVLFASHALVGAATISNAVARGVLGEGLLGARHLNLPVLMRAGGSALTLLDAERKHRQLEPPSWDDLLLGQRLPWNLDAAKVLADASVR